MVIKCGLGSHHAGWYALSRIGIAAADSASSGGLGAKAEARSYDANSV
jgi:hypothetical protein